MGSRMEGGDKREGEGKPVAYSPPWVYPISYSRDETFCRETTALTEDIVRTLHRKSTTVPARG